MKSRIKTKRSAVKRIMPRQWHDWDRCTLNTLRLFFTQAYLLSDNQIAALANEQGTGFDLLASIERLKNAGLLKDAELLAKPFSNSAPLFESGRGLASIEDTNSPPNRRESHLQLTKITVASRVACNLFGIDFRTSDDHDQLQRAFNLSEIFVKCSLANRGQRWHWLRGDQIERKLAVVPDAIASWPASKKGSFIYLRRPSLWSRIDVLVSQCRAQRCDLQIW